MTLGLGGSLLTLLFSIGGNGPAITGLRCLYAFIVFFALAFLFRAALAVILKPRPAAMQQAAAAEEQPKGQAIDYSTPDQSEELRELLGYRTDGDATPESSRQADFKPLSPPKLVSTHNKEPEELAKAIRHLTGG
ncbi:hypothetical protein [Paenibacillus sp. GCM10023250]|uniref:hypothetical protein n=1 Tax=Paenibacillus sp. GCM10023250 TaxID=3252648 RepID=UPI0036D223A7